MNYLMSLVCSAKISMCIKIENHLKFKRNRLYKLGNVLDYACEEDIRNS